MIQKQIYENRYGERRHTVLFWLRNARILTLPLSLLPATLAYVMSTKEPHFTWWIGILTLVGVAVAHLGLNLANDFFYFRRHHPTNDEEEKETNKARFYTSTRCSYITSGQATMNELYHAIRIIFFICGIFAFASFICRIFVDNSNIILHPRALDHSALYIAFYGLLGMVVGVLYSAGPRQCSEHGWGEIMIGLMFGPLIMLGMQAACCGIGLSAPMIVMSGTIGLLVVNITYMSAVIEGGKEAVFGKKIFFFAPEGSKIACLCELFNVIVCALAPYAIVGAGIAAGWWDTWCLLVFLILPLSIYMIVTFVKCLCKDQKLKDHSVFAMLSHHVVILWCSILIIAMSMPEIMDIFH